MPVQASSSEQKSDSAPPPAAPEAGPPVPPSLPDITVAPKPLNRGPFAAVYRGWDRAHRCEVIVKVQRATGDPIAAERFRREAAVMKRLRHPNIIALYRFHDGDPAALVMEYVPGRTLAALVEAEGWLTPQRAAQVIGQVAAALDCAHAQGIIHRDVKPSNILLPTRGPARLFDFGVAHIDDEAPLTVMGDILGTIEYASPEQVHGNETPDARSDVYSLAAVAYFALTKTPPFRAADSSTQAQLSVMHRQVFAVPPPLRLYREDLAPAVEAAVLRGLAKAPADRYPSAGQFAAALLAAVESGAGAPEQRAIAAASRRTGASAGALAAATLLLLGAFALWKTGHLAAPHPAQVAQAAKTPKRTLPKASVPVPTTPAPIAVVRPPRPKAASATQMASTPSPVHKPLLVVRPQPAKTASSLNPARAKPAPIKSVGRSRPLVAAIPPVRHGPLPPHPPAQAAPSKMTVATQKRAWLSVYAEQNLTPLESKERMAGITPQSVWVDGYRASDLAGGHWTSLPAGHHVISFIPDPKSGFAPNKYVLVTLKPGEHVRKQILLPVSAGVHTPLVAALAGTPKPLKVLPSEAPVAAVPHPVGWYTVSGWVPAAVPGHRSSLVRASAQWVKVDGRPVPALALGRWAQLPAGKHVVTFQPTPTLGIGPKTWNINLSAQARLSQKIPFPTAPMLSVPLAAQPTGRLSVSGWLPVALPGQKPELVPVPAEWVKIDGRPSEDLAHGLWVSLPAGRHVLVFQPMPGSGANPATRIISLSPQGHLNQLIPLPAAPLPITPPHLRDP